MGIADKADQAKEKAKDSAREALDSSDTGAETSSSDESSEGTIAGKRDNFSQQVQTKNDTAQNAE